MPEISSSTSENNFCQAKNKGDGDLTFFSFSLSFNPQFMHENSAI